ncbi:MAG: bestrophin family ion channel, partial [Pedobacter sp.]
MVPVLVYELADIKWIAIPWTIVALLGTATAFIVGFKNTQTYNRTSEALDVWYAILNFSRSFGVMSRDFVDDPLKVKEILCRHLAWVTSLRYQMREQRIWESTEKKHNAEFQRFY